MFIAARRVLLVDGHVDSVDSLAMLLELYGHDVERCYDAGRAMQAALGFGPDVVLIEQRLPGPSDGFALGCSMLREPRLAGTAVALQTAVARPEDRDRARAAGFADLLLKPADPDEILRLIERIPAGDATQAA
jgi:CheY-like chemotaxis protein